MELAYLGGDRRTLRQGSGLRTAGGRADAYLPHDGPESGCERSDGFRRQVPFVSLPVGAQGPLLERYDRVRPRGQYAGHALVAQLRGVYHRSGMECPDRPQVGGLSLQRHRGVHALASGDLHLLCR